jgi:hypothetical protein
MEVAVFAVRVTDMSPTLTVGTTLKLLLVVIVTVSNASNTDDDPDN